MNPSRRERRRRDPASVGRGSIPRALRTTLRSLTAAALAVAAAPLMRASHDYAIGADLSFLRQAEERGVRFKDGGVEKPGLQIFKDHGYNWVRLRLFHTPTRLPNDLAYTIASARDARAHGFKVLLNYHYSDTWADPAKQFVPKAWEGLEGAALEAAVHDYTRDAIAAFREAGVLPDMVQIGNEITPGMLWPHGRLPQNWDAFARLVQAGIRGVDAGRGDAPRPRIMVHIEKGGDRARTKWFSTTSSSAGSSSTSSVSRTTPGGTARCWTCGTISRSWPRPTGRTSFSWRSRTTGGPPNT